MTGYHRPTSLDEALAIRAGEAVTVLAGGTDVFPARAARAGWGDHRRGAILDISAIATLRGIEETAESVRFGALTTWTDLARAKLPAAFAGWQAAAGAVGGAQVQNRGTLAGNLCTASPAGDGIPCLLSLDARVEVASLAGRRLLPAADFLTGYRSTALAPDEIVTALVVPAPPAGTRGGFVKLGARRYLVISIAMVAAAVTVDEAGVITRAGIAVGACSAVGRRLASLEADLVGVPVREAAAVVTASHADGLTPIDDIRASGDYRRDAVLTILADCLAGIAANTDRRAA